MGGNITKISDGNYTLDNKLEMNITNTDNSWSNTTKKYIPKFAVGDHLVPNGDIRSRYIVREVNLTDDKYYISYVSNNVSSSNTIGAIDGNSVKIDLVIPHFKIGDYIYSIDTLEYYKVTNISTEYENYTLKYYWNKTIILDFMNDNRYEKLNPYNPPNGLYLFKDSDTGLRYIYDEFTGTGFYVVINTRTGEVTKVEKVTRVIYSSETNSKKNGYSNGDLIGAAIIGGLIGHTI